MNRRGFTLGGAFLVVAAVVAVLAILFPVVGRAKVRRQQSTCESNLKQLAGALLLYAEDHGGYLPQWALSGGRGADDAWTWDEQISRYYRDCSVLLCPANPYGRCNRSYAMPQYVSGIDAGRPYSPSMVVLLFEKGAYPPGSWQDATATNFRQSTDRQDVPNESAFHQRGKYFLFLDSHVEYHKLGTGPFEWSPRVMVLPGTCVLPVDAPMGDWARPED